MLPILIVEDEPNIATLIEMALEPLGQPLVVAHDGEHAADLVETQKFDLVLLDIMLPGVDGFALMQYLAPTGTPVVFLTAKNAVADRVRGLKLGAYDYIVKPFAPAELLDAPRTYSYNGVTLTVAAEDGNGLRVSSSDCPTQDCVRTGTISRSGQSIVCLPARIIIQLTGGAADSNDVDIVIG